mgnify:CR=1 FL=1
MKKEEIALLKRKIFLKLGKDNIRAIVFFGSRARGDYREDSDYDINVYLTHRKNTWGIGFNNFINYQINIIDTIRFRDMKKEAHPFLYCTFRDGIPLYQKDKWFDKTRKSILLMSPTSKIVKEYFRRGLGQLCSLYWRLGRDKKDFFPLIDLHYEDGKVAANHIGFGLVMFYKKYPKSPRTLGQEIIRLNKGYKRLALTIKYLQRAYYESASSSKRVYMQNVQNLYLFTKRFVQKNFSKEYKEIQTLEKIYRKVDRDMKLKKQLNIEK